MNVIDHILTRGVDKIYPSKEALASQLETGKKLTLYQGFDPSGAQLHIGHAVAMRKLRQFQDLGHKVIFLIGDFTGMIGDPTGKGSERKKLSHKQVLENAKNYKEQASKILRFDGENPVEIKFNSHWLSKLSFADIIELAAHFTVQQMIERDMFEKRLKANIPIHMHEFFYPLMQGYDSVAMDVDLELGGSDQTFDMLAGRTLLKSIRNKEKFVLTVPLLTDSKGVKIGKTEGNVIGLSDTPIDVYGKIMSLGDDAIVPCFTLLTDVPVEEINTIESRMKTGSDNPMTYKKRLAFELTKYLNSENDAKIAEQAFETRFQKGDVSRVELPVISLSSLPLFGTGIEYMVAVKLAKSNSEARRLIEQKAFKINDIVVGNPKEQLHIKSGDIFQAGRKAVKIVE